MNKNLIFHYQQVIHNASRDGIYIHEAFSTRNGILYMVNPVPTEVSGDTEEDIDILLKTMEGDRTKYKPVNVNDIVKQMSLWIDEVEVAQDIVVPEYEDQEDFELDNLDEQGEVIAIDDYIKRNK